MAGLVWSPGAADNVQLTGNLNQMQDVIVADTKTRGLKMFLPHLVNGSDSSVLG